jgi:glycosyltransferase involved in cell wall biosynthesis
MSARTIHYIIRTDETNWRARLAREGAAAEDVLARSDMGGNYLSRALGIRRMKPARVVSCCGNLNYEKRIAAQRLFVLLCGAPEGELRDLAGGSMKAGWREFICRDVPRLLAELALEGALLLTLPFLLMLLRYILKLESRFRAGIMRRAAATETMTVAYLRTDDFGAIRVGGSFTHIEGFAKGMLKLKHRLFFVSSGPPTSEPLAGTELFEIPYPGIFNMFGEFPQMAYNCIFNRRAWKIMRGKRPDFIYQRYSDFNCSGVVLSRLLRIPLVLEVNGSELWVAEVWGNLKHRFIIRLFEDISFRFADAIVVVSDVLKHDLVRYGLDPGKIIVNPNGVEVDEFRPDVPPAVEARALAGKSVTLVGFLGTFGVWHGVVALADVIVEIAKRGRTDIRFMLIGEGDLRKDCEKKIADGGASGMVRFLGKVRHADVPSHLAACDILVSPHVPLTDGSEFFGSPTKLFEYMAMGRAIVASDLAQIGRVLEHGRSALMVKPGDVQGLADAIIKLADDPALRAKLGANAREDAVNKHTWVKNADRVVEYLKSSGVQEFRS